MIVISNSSPLIALSLISQLNLLEELFGEIFIPPEIYQEIVIRGKGKVGEKEVKGANWVKVIEIKERKAVRVLQDDFGLSKGENEVIALAKENLADLVLLDEEPARKVAERMGLKVMGTVGLLLVAKKNKLIPKVKNYLDIIKKKGFRVSNKIYKESLEKAGEL